MERGILNFRYSALEGEGTIYLTPSGLHLFRELSLVNGATVRLLFRNSMCFVVK